MKKTPALIAAFGMTALVGLGMLLMGANGLFNPSSVALVNAPGTIEMPAPASEDIATDVQQLQALLGQYQSREQQYQQQLNQLQQQVNDSSKTLQQNQQLLSELQRRGLIQINQNGQIQLSRGTARHDDDDD